jgi:uncharacterized damage-inducible protein DinB
MIGGMRLREQAVALAAYNSWMNEKLYAAAAQLTDEQRKKDLGAFFRSVHGTLNHLLLADRSWLQRFRGEPVTMTSPHDELYAAFEKLRSARRVADLEIEQLAAGLDDAFADAPFRFWSVTYGKERVLPGWAAVTHMFNHQAHHRGQATTLLTQLGQDVGVTDLPWMPYFD